MREYGFSLTRILPYKDRIYDLRSTESTEEYASEKCVTADVYLHKK